MGVKTQIVKAFLEVVAHDKHLLKVDASERSITHRFAVYIERKFPGFDVDCEFNRTGIDPKRLVGFKRRVDSDVPKAVTVFPDVIVHKRNTPTNHIVIEAKTTSNHETCRAPKHCKCDLCKLKAYKSELGYAYAFYVIFPVGRKLESVTAAVADSYITEV